MSEKIVQITIDGRDYLFKLSSQDEISRLKELSNQLEKRILQNKRTITTTDYNKVLILTCLNLLEEMSQNRKNNSQQNSFDLKDLEFKLNHIKSLLKNPRNDFS